MTSRHLTEEAAIIHAATAKRGSKKAIADAIGVTPAFISQLANGHRPVPWDKAEAIAHEIGCAPEEISAEYAAMKQRSMLPGVPHSAPSQAPAASHPVRLDVETLASAIATIESAFDKAGATMSAIGRAKIIAAYYADLVRTPDMDPKAAADAALAAVIRAMSKGAKDDQHVPAR